MKKVKVNKKQVKRNIKDFSRATGVLVSAFSIVGLGFLIHKHHL